MARPDNLDRLTVDDLAKLSIKDGERYWDGKKLIREQRLALTGAQNFFAAIFAIITTSAAAASLTLDANEIFWEKDCVLGIIGPCVKRTLTLPSSNTAQGKFGKDCPQ